MPQWGSFSFAYGPLVALGGIGLLALLLRWAFSHGGSPSPVPPQPGPPDAYGLLTPVSAPATYVEGEMLRRRLEDAGVRAALVSTNDGPRVMVWPADVARARSLLQQGQ